jgi:hypothetical protein
MDITPERIGAAIQAMYAHFSQRIHLPSLIQKGMKFIVQVPPGTSDADICLLSALVSAPDRLALKNIAVEVKAADSVDPI